MYILLIEDAIDSAVELVVVISVSSIVVAPSVKHLDTTKMKQRKNNILLETLLPTLDICEK